MSKVLIAAALAALAAFVAFQAANRGPAKPLMCQLLAANCPPFRFSGHVKPGWEPVLRVVEVVWEQGYEVGSQLTVMHKGETVIDVAIGFEDNSYKEFYTDQHLQLVFSSTKFVTSLVIAKAIEQGAFQLEDPIAKHWPGFEHGEKGEITVADLLSHAGGIHHVAQLLPHETLRKAGPDLRELLAQTQIDSRTWRQNGGQTYHGITRGLYLNALLEVTDGRTVRKFLHEEILREMEIPKSEFSIGVDMQDKLFKRMGKMNMAPLDKTLLGFLPRFLAPRWTWQSLPFDDVFLTAEEVNVYHQMGTPGSIPHSAFTIFKDGPATLDEYVTAPEWFGIHSPSSHGITNSKTLARLAAVFAHDGIDPVTSKRILKSTTAQLAYDMYPKLDEAILGKTFSYSKLGLGDWVDLVQRPAFFKDIIDYDKATAQCIGWGGAGGSLVQACRKSQLAIGYSTNLYQPHITDWRATAYMIKALEVATNASQATF